MSLFQKVGALAATTQAGRDWLATIDPTQEIAVAFRNIRVGAGIANELDYKILNDHAASQKKQHAIGLTVVGAVMGGAGVLAAGGSLTSGAMANKLAPAALSLVTKKSTPAPTAPKGTKMDIFNEDGGLDWGGITSQLTNTLLQVAVNRAGNAQSIAPLTLPALPGAENVALGGMAGTAMRALGLTGMGAVAAGAVGILRSAGGRILGWILPSGMKVSRKAAVDLAKRVGISVAAGALGATTVELAEAIMQEEGRPRRGRGITAAQLRVTTRTMGKVERMHRKIAKAARAHSR